MRRAFGEIDTYGFSEIVRMYCGYPSLNLRSEIGARL